MRLTPQEIKTITDYLFISAPPEKSDLVFIPGTSHFLVPMAITHKLWKEGYSGKILVSGGINEHTGKNEADGMLENLISLGVPKNIVFKERKSSNTLENVVYSRKIIDIEFGIRNIRSVLVVVKNYHARRAIMTLKKNLSPSIKYFPIEYDVLGFTKDTWANEEKNRERVLGEYQKIKTYLQKGDLEEL